MEIYELINSGAIVKYKLENNINYCLTYYNTWKASSFLTKQDVLNHYIPLGWVEVAMKHDPNDLFSLDDLFSLKACCNGGIGPNPAYMNGKWHDEQCPDLKQQSFKLVDTYSPKKTGCTCGSTAVGSDRHSDYCDLYKKG